MMDAKDPTEVLRAAIAAATQPEPESKLKNPEQQPVPTMRETSNVLIHPATEKIASPMGIQHYFVLTQPRTMRCDPAYGVGLEFPISPYKQR